MRSNHAATGDDIVLVDMMNLVFRQHFAHQHLSSGDDKTGATFGVLKTVHDLRESVSKRIVFVWDHGVPVLGAPKPRNWRDDMMDGYKAARKPNDAYAEIVPQLVPLYRILSLLGYSHAAVMGLEADDVIGVLAKSAWPGCVKLIFSTDRDYYQLLDEAWIHVLTPKKDKGGFKTVFQSDVEREYGIPVSRWAEYLALGGDKSDSIKPLRGMGPKTALRLIESGVNLNLPLTERHQPTDFLAKYGGVLDLVKKCHSAARVPTRWDDPRISASMRSAGLMPSAYDDLSPDQSWRDADARARALREFTAFLADRSMLSLMAESKSFFDTESNTCQRQIPNSLNPTKAVQKRKTFAPRRPIKRLL